MPKYIYAPHTFVKDGIFYFIRRIPVDVRKHYTATKISHSLKTRLPQVAASRAMRTASQLDEYWYQLKCQDVQLPGQHLLKTSSIVVSRHGHTTDVKTTTLNVSDCVEIYLGQKGVGKGDTFKRAATRNCGYVIKYCGNLYIDQLTKAHANKLRDALVAKGMAGSSIARILGTVRSVLNFAASEEGIDFRNPFGSVYFDRSAKVQVRSPVQAHDIKIVQAACHKMDDDVRWLVALVADSGMRIAEAAGLSCEDIQVDDDGNISVQIIPHPWRRLKTSQSERTIPLVGSSAWAAKRILASQGQGSFAFPRYNKTDVTNANSASAAANKWLRAYLPEGTSMHGFRHSMRDRLRAVECPADIVDQIGGWGTVGVGQSYGSGYPVAVLRKYMDKISYNI
ncbi:Phage integrase family protein [Loktanella sp. DSM 29012]|uniref:DUF6538 domain-containing protein n=1 Tax=Loktanella sp. DSM 29012 TaxID=1881056 RepID=UPI0008C41C3D|nr:DUF6538 domain-containing protein [Loktanella sp. DSM 29012]SEQ86528.1 Phage integrase family protein [Loktanella sp. DSM 29012]